MIGKETKIENARFVDGDLGVHFVYTAGIAGEAFFRALAKGKVLASTCGECATTYCPPRIFCERCFAEVDDRHEVKPVGTLVSVARVHRATGGGAQDPEWAGAVRLDGTDTTLVHRIEGHAPAIGARVEATWAPKRTGSILDIRGFRLLGTPAKQSVAITAERTNGRAGSRRRVLAR